MISFGWRGSPAHGPVHLPWAGVGARVTFLRAGPLRVLELGAFLDRRLLELRADPLTHRLDPLGDDGPLLAVPLLHHRHAVAFVVVARDLDPPGGGPPPGLLETLLGEVQVLEAPAHLLRGG